MGVVATAIPVMTDTGEGALEQVMGNVIGDWTESSQQDSGDEVQDKVGGIYRAGHDNVEQPVDRFLERHGRDKFGDFGQDLQEAWKGGYGDGTDGEDQQGKRPQTGK